MEMDSPTIIAVMALLTGIWTIVKFLLGSVKENQASLKKEQDNLNKRMYKLECMLNEIIHNMKKEHTSWEKWQQSRS